MSVRKLLVLLAVTALAAFMACGEEEPAAELDETAEIEAPEVVDSIIEPAETEMTDEEKMAFVMENCICPQCPSWVPEASENGEGGYCLTGMSECIVIEAGCVCPDCPVTREMGLEWGYYCTRGSVEEMMASQEE